MNAPYPTPVYSTLRFPRTLREAFPAERYAAIEIGPRRPRFNPERHLVGPALVLVAIGTVILLATKVIS
jgi:hypothetical protein